MQTTREALVESRQIVLAAQTEAARIKREAELDAVQVRERATAAGIAEGLARSAIQLSQLEAARHNVLLSLTDSIAAVICRISEELFENPPYPQSEVAYRLKLALEQVTFADRLTVILHPDSRSSADAVLNSLSSSGTRAQIVIREDQTLPLGACRLETETAVIESDPKVHLAAILDHLRKHAAELFSLPTTVLEDV